MKFYLVSATLIVPDGHAFASTTFAGTALPGNTEEYTDFHNMIASSFNVKREDMVIISITELNEFTTS